jgi:hypothetical protein
MVNLGIIFGLLLASAALTIVVAFARPQQTPLVALGSMALLCFAWLLARPALPLSLSIGPAGGGWPGWSWQVGPLAWTVSLAVFLLSLGALALDAQRYGARRQPFDTALIMLLAVATLAACWAGSLATHVLTWTLLAAIWIGGMALSARGHEQRMASLSWRAGAALAAVLLLWLAAASAGPAADMSGVAAWSTLTRSLVLLAATYQLAVFPFHRLRLSDWALPPALSAMLTLAPAAAGAVLLARLEAGSEIGLAFALPFTLMGLLALLAAVRRAWIASNAGRSLPLALIQAQTGLVLLAGVWADPQAVLAETIVLLLGGGILLLAGNRRESHLPGRVPQPGALLAIAAFAALPLTAGFTGRSALYGAWLEEGRWVLVLATALLYLPLLTALLIAHLPTGRPGDNSETQAPKPDLPRVLTFLLPALGLFSVVLGQASVATWLAILLPALLAVFFAWRLREITELRQMLREAFTMPALPTAPPWSGARRVFSAAWTAAREALVILEGEGGLLWLLLFVVILYLVQ